MSQRNSLVHDDYTVGWISALPIEMAAAQALLDEVHPSLPVPRHDHNAYTLGRIGEHNVIIACLPSGIYGSTSATAVATRLRSSFPSIRFGLMVGIGGGVPNSDADIRLGDVVVSKPTDTHGGVVQYDFGKAMTREKGFQRVGMLNGPPQVLLAAIAKLQAMHLTQARRFLGFVEELESTLPSDRQAPFARPAAKDRLYMADYKHVNLKNMTCRNCDPNKLVARSPRNQSELPVIHYGLIASGNQVVKDAEIRDKICGELGAYCLEMEAAGLMNDYPCLVVRGICDYADSHKNKSWQGYAAATAAAFAKELLLVVPDTQKQKREAAQDVALTETDARFRIPLDLRNVPAIQKFIGREDELERLWQGLRPDCSPIRKVGVLHGLGGIGKTQLAARFARVHKDHFSGIFWLNAKDRSALMQSLATAWSRVPHRADTACTPNNDGATQIRISNDDDLNQRAQTMLKWLTTEGNARWLLIYDNVDQFSEDISDFFPVADHGSIIITTRLLRLAELGTGFPIHKLDPENATRLLFGSAGWNAQKHDPNEPDPGVTALISRLDGLPLAITIAGSYIRQSGVSVAQYLRFYTESWEDLMVQTPQSQYYAHGNLLTTWLITYNEIRKCHPASAQLLLLLAIFDNRDIWFELIKNCGHTSNLPSWFVNSLRSELAFLATLKPLIAFSLVETKQEGGSYSMHPVVQDWCLSVLHENDSLRNVDEFKVMALTAVSYLPPPTTEIEHSKLQQRLISHADQMRWHIARWKMPDEPEIYTAIHDLGCLYLAQGKLKEARDLYERALTGKEKLLGLTDISTLETVNNLGLVYTNRGELQKAEKMCQRAVAGREQALGRGHISTLHAVNNLGFLYTRQDNSLEARRLYKRALAGFDKELGPGNISSLDMINNLGLLYTRDNKWQPAEMMYQQALAGFEKALGSAHTSTLITVYNLGSLYEAQGNLEEARHANEV
ncbi:hypothetical protein BJY01DRAFT_241007 [Aspergillus pseudoustus]|uniref:Nucleoside phosphorylase domain-containing protein n=1 Tax=Aspergillus pseudoustus TaxID=1810923 RepID=A0ABR4IJW6_9EURO